MNDTTLIIPLLVVTGLALFVLPWWRIKRAVPQIVRIFREQNAIGIKNAKAPEELGVSLPGMMEGVLSRRDYKRYALKALMKAEVIQMTEDGKFYLSEEKLLSSNLYNKSQ